jgi:phenylpropionate dioxygenase-like ring-hydroxylating dioxygenase large terminal subunit
MTVADRDVEPHDEVDAPVASPLALPGSRYPTGWFQVGWSADLAPGDVRTVTYFGRELVLWRSAAGEAHVSDAYCLHLGANLGVRGTVDGEELVCPWHGWHWDGEGRNTLIPYSAQTCKKNLRLETFPVQEWYGCIVVWHDEAGGPPSWQPPVIDDLEADTHHPFDPARNHSWRIKAHPQMVMENGVDAFHVPFIHGAGEIPVIREVVAEGHEWRTIIDVTYGAGKESTWLTPDGAVEAAMRFDLWGIGLGLAVWPDLLLGGRMITNPTPIDETHTELFWCMTTAKVDGEDAPSRGAVRMMDSQREIVAMDFFTWEHMKVLHTPSFAPEEAKYYAAMRRWAWQFYPGGETVLAEIGSHDSGRADS